MSKKNNQIIEKDEYLQAKKKMDEMGDLKRQIKYLEEKNSEYINNNMDLEEELGKVSKKKPQTDLFRKQVRNRYHTKF